MDGQPTFTVEELPDEVIMLILHQLPPLEKTRAARVCRRWARIAERHTLHVRTAADARRVHDALHTLFVTVALPAAVPVLCGARGLRELTVSAVAPLAEDQLLALAPLQHLAHLDAFLRERRVGRGAAPLLARLTTLVLNETAAPPLLRLLAAGGRLRALHMFGRARYFERTDLRALLAVRRDHLRELTLRCAELRDKEYAAIGACANLSSLQLYSCWMMTGAGALHAARPPRLRRLHVTGARLVRTRALLALLHALPPRLAELALSASWFCDAHAAALAARLPALRRLELWRCRVTAPRLVELARALPALEELDVDLPLSARHRAALAALPALRRLRCAPAPAADADDPDVAELGPPPAEAHRRASLEPLRVWRADALYAPGYLRGESEGYCADMFYYWMQSVPLPLASASESHEHVDCAFPADLAAPRRPRHRPSFTSAHKFIL